MAVKDASIAAWRVLTKLMSSNFAEQHDAMVAAVHQLRPQSHDKQTKGSLLRLLVYLAACLHVANKVATLACMTENYCEEHQPSVSHGSGPLGRHPTCRTSRQSCQCSIICLTVVPRCLDSHIAELRFSAEINLGIYGLS